MSHSCQRRRAEPSRQRRKLARSVELSHCWLSRKLARWPVWVCLQVCERIETRRSRKSIESEISKFRRRIQQEEPHAAERDGVARSYTEKMELYQKTMATIRGHRAALKVC